MSDAVLKLSNVESAYGPIKAIRGVSLQVMPGQIATVLGSNGDDERLTFLASHGQRASDTNLPLGVRVPDEVKWIPVARASLTDQELALRIGREPESRGASFLWTCRGFGPLRRLEW